VAAKGRLGPERAVLGIWLAAVAGFVDAVGYIQLHNLFVAHMTGNTNQFGQRLALTHLSAAVPLVVAVASFVGSIAIVTYLTDVADENGLRSPTAAGLAVEAALLALFMAYGSTVRHHDTVPGHGVSFYICAIAAVCAMGAQTAALSKWGGRTIRTTYVSGMLTRLGQQLARLPQIHRRGGSSKDNEAHPGMAAVYFALFLGFLGGGVLGTWSLSRISLWSLALPLGAVVTASVVDSWRPAR
jgi:uncharacterized membrane protein YoaK (UPF0700 family)